MRKTIFLIVVFYSCVSISQSINDYKYVIVPSQFDFAQKPDAYRLNTMTKSLLEKQGFVVFFDNGDVPNDLIDSNCNKLYADLKSEGSFLKTKLVLYIKDCKKNVLFSANGENREKEYGISYNLALREIEKKLNASEYKYNGKNGDKSEIQPIVSENHVAAATDVLLAQPLANGFQLVDATPKAVMKLQKTSSKEIYIADKGALKGVMYNRSGVWIFEYYVGEKLVTETLNIKF